MCPQPASSPSAKKMAASAMAVREYTLKDYEYLYFTPKKLQEIRAAAETAFFGNIDHLNLFNIVKQNGGPENLPKKVTLNDVSRVTAYDQWGAATLI